MSRAVATPDKTDLAMKVGFHGSLSTWHMRELLQYV